MLLRILLIILVCISSENSGATTFISSQDGDWEDALTWNNHPLADTVSFDTIIVNHNIHFNNHLLLTHVLLLLDSAGSLCGHYVIHCVNSQFIQYGDFYIDSLNIQSSQWNGYSGFWQIKYDALYWGGGYGSSTTCCGCHGFVGGDFNCTIPPQTTIYPDTSHTDTTLSYIRVYPNPFSEYFIVETELQKNHSSVELNIYDFFGRDIKTISIPQGKFTYSVFTTDWTVGMYLLRFTEGAIVLREMKITMVQ